jgi:hypothetical protein
MARPDPLHRTVFGVTAYGQFLHHHPDGGAPAAVAALTDSVDEQLRRTVIAWSLVATPGEQCVLWDLDNHVGVDQPWGLDLARVAAIQTAVARLNVAAENNELANGHTPRAGEHVAATWRLADGRFA